MTILLSTLAVAFAAICVWLVVRIVKRRERWAKWTLAAALSLPVMYFASFGPACWLVRNRVLPFRSAQAIYNPILHRCVASDQFNDLSMWLLSANDDAMRAFFELMIFTIDPNFAGPQWPASRIAKVTTRDSSGTASPAAVEFRLVPAA